LTVSAPLKVFAVELLDGGLRAFVGRHLDEAEAARALRLAVGHDVGGADLACLRKQFVKFVAGRAERKVSHVESRSHVSFILLCWGKRGRGVTAGAR
jgi:hypothetical protein